MAAKEETPKDASTANEPQVGKDASAENDQQNVINKVAAMPLVSATRKKVSATYSSAKGSHPAVQTVCEKTETEVKTVVTSAASRAQPLLDRAQPLLDKFEPQIAAANYYACKGIDKLEEKLPAGQRTVEKLASKDKKTNEEEAMNV
ncbi:UNVERIFIED_CONTAM: hypothetical protein K2H54_043675 [Gekko kuhli]